MATKHEQAPTLESLKTTTGVTDAQLNLPCSDEDLLEISKHINNYTDYAVKFQLYAGQIKTAEGKSEYHEKVYYVLRVWKDRNGTGATYRRLLDVSLGFKHGHVAENICMLCAKQGSPEQRSTRQQQTATKRSPAGGQRGYQTMVQCKETLVSNMAESIEGFADVFRQEGLITDETYNSLISTGIYEKTKKSRILVNTLTQKSKTSETFHKIIDVLISQGNWTEDIVETLKRKYEELGGSDFPDGHPSPNPIPSAANQPRAPGVATPADETAALEHENDRYLFCTNDSLRSAMYKTDEEAEQPLRPDVSYGVARPENLWDVPELKVHFLNDPNCKVGDGADPLTSSHVLTWVTNGWNRQREYPGIPVINRAQTALPDQAHIRVKFSDSGRSHSYVGRSARIACPKLKSTDPTMTLNLHGLTETQQMSLVLHEFGHALGLDHEHQRSKFWDTLDAFTIEKQKMRDGIGCRKAVDEVFRDPKLDFAEGTEYYDSKSIMHYWFDIKWLKPEYRNLSSPEFKGLSPKKQEVIQGVHDRDYNVNRGGYMATEPSKTDLSFLNKLYQDNHLQRNGGRPSKPTKSPPGLQTGGPWWKCNGCGFTFVFFSVLVSIVLAIAIGWFVGVA